MTQNPNWPNLSVKTWPVNPPPGGAMPTSAATDLTPKTRNIKITRGRQYELDQDQAGGATCTVDNSTGALTAGANGNLPMRPCQITATWSGTTYPLFTGYVERWPTQSDDPSRATSTLQLVDLFAALTQRTVRSAVIETIEQLSPTYFWPLTDAALSETAGNIAPATAGQFPLSLFSNSAAVKPTTGYTSGGLGTTGVLSFDNVPGFTWTTSQNPPGNEGLVTALNRPGMPSWDTTQPWAFCIAVTSQGTFPSAGSQAYIPIINLLDLTAVNYLWVNFSEWSPAGSPAQQGGAVTGYPSRQTSTGYFGISLQANSTGGPCLISVGWDGSNYWASLTTSDGVAHAGTVTYFNGMTGSTPINPPASLSVGYPWTASGFPGNTLYSGPIPAFPDLPMNYFALWTAAGSPSVPTATTVASWSLNAAITGWLGETATTRAARIMSWLGITNTALEPTSNPLGQSSVSPTDAMADVLRQVALDDLARIFMTAGGAVALQSRNHNQQNLTTPIAIGSNIAGGEVPYTTPPVIDFDPTRIFNDVQVQQIGGVSTRSQDTTSQNSYFQRVLQLQVNQQNAVDALYCSQWLLGRYKQPSPRVETVTIDIGANPGWHPTVLALELGQWVVLNHRTITAATLTGLFQVDQIVHDITDGKKWTVTLQLSPVLAVYGLYGGMRTTLSSAVALGATTIRLAPLADAAVNAAESSLPVGTVLVVDGASATKAETVTVASVTSSPTPNAAGYTSVTVGLTSGLAHGHATGVPCWEQTSPGITGSTYGDPNDWNSTRSLLDTELLLGW